MKNKILWFSGLALCALIALPLLAQDGSTKEITKGQGIQAPDCGCGGQCGEKCDGKCKGQCGEKCDCGGQCDEKCQGQCDEKCAEKCNGHESKQGCGGCGGCGSAKKAFGFDADFKVIETLDD